jgi:hypothetical protein
MNLFQSFRNAVQSWRLKRTIRRARKRTGLSLECLDHRRLLAVNFTGNAAADIPDPPAPGVAIINNATRIPILDPALADLIKVTGFDISAIRMQYTPDDDILSFALQQPGNQKTSPEFPVIAGDADNNLDGGTVAPDVLALRPQFKDFITLGGSETMAVFLDFTGDNIPDVVAGISNDAGAGKLYQVGSAVPNPGAPTTTAPGFGAPLQNNTGFAFLRDEDPTAGAFEFQITRFSELFASISGQTLQANTVINVGAFAGSNDDFINELFIQGQPVSFGVAPPPVDCPPLSPPVLINPHQTRHVNTAHRNLVRVNIFGTSGFDVDNIIPASVRLGGAEPAFDFARRINRDPFPDRTFVFEGDELNLPPGRQRAVVTGLYNDPASGQIIPIETATPIFVRRGANSPAAERAQERRLARRDPVEAVTEALQRRAARLGLTWRTGAAASETGPGATANTRISRRDAVRERVSERRTDISSRRAGLHRDAVEQAASRAEAVRGRIAQARARVPEARPSVRVDTTPRVSRPVTRLHAMHEADLHDLAVSHLSV